MATVETQSNPSSETPPSISQFWHVLLVMGKINYIPEENFEPANVNNKVHINKQRFSVQLSKSNFLQDIINFVKDYVYPNVKEYIYFEHPIYEKFSTVI